MSEPKFQEPQRLTKVVVHPEDYEDAVRNLFVCDDTQEKGWAVVQFNDDAWSLEGRLPQEGDR